MPLASDGVRWVDRRTKSHPNELEQLELRQRAGSSTCRRAEDDEHLIADIPICGERVTVHVTIDDGGRVRSDHLNRWGDPGGTGTFGWTPFGVEVTASRTFPCGITMPADGSGHWFHGTDRSKEGEFMRYSISEVVLI